MKISTSLGLRILLVLAAIALTVVPFPPSWIEAGYSTGLYPRLAAIIKPMTRWTPVPVLDILLVAVAIGLPALWIWKIRRAPAGHRWVGVLHAAVATLTFAAFLTCGFQLLWGLNYQRLPLSAKLDWDAKRVTPATTIALSRSTIEHLNAEVTGAHAHAMPPLEEWRPNLERSFRLVVRELGHVPDFTSVAPRTSVVNSLLAAEGCDGFINPFGYEVILNSHILPIETPGLLAHEWAHLAGFADESEANFIAILACIRSDLPAIRYSGWLLLSFYVRRHSSDPNDLLPALASPVTADLEAIQARINKFYRPAIGNIQERVYNRFLKANHVQAGIGSYALVTRLLVGTRFTGNWTPALSNSHD